MPRSRRSRLSFLFGVSFASLRLVRSVYGLEERVYTLIVPGSHHVENLLAVCPVEVVLLLSGHPLDHGVEGIVLAHATNSPACMPTSWPSRSRPWMRAR